jgi:hypothetical protein
MRSLRHLLAPLALALLASAAGAAALSCGTDAMGTDACRKVEQARCRKGPACPALNVPAGTGVEECVQFARDRCLHGLANPDPGVAAADQCAAAIDQSTTCDAVLSPETLPACSFLRPATSGTDDAGSDATDATDAADASSTASDGSIDAARDAGD